MRERGWGEGAGTVLARFHGLAALLLLALLLPLPAAAGVGVGAAAPSRIVSLNLCADELLLRLVEPEVVASITWLGADPRVSTVAAQAEGLHLNHGLAEEILPLRPDLVLAGRYTTRPTVALLQRIGIPVLELEVPNSLAEVYAQIETVAEALGRGEGGRALVARMQADLAALSPPEPPGSRPLAAVYRPNGFTVGPGTLADEVLRLAGLRNLAAELPQDRHGPLPLELLLWQRPELLILNSAEEPLPSLAQSVLEHPVLSAAFPAWRSVVVPPSLWSCGGPGLVEAVTLLRGAAGRLRSAEAAP